MHGSRMQLLEPEGTSKEAQCQELSYRETSPPSSVINEVSTLAETEGKAQEAPSQGVQEEGTKLISLITFFKSQPLSWCPRGD